jgi:spore coat protein A
VKKTFRYDNDQEAATLWYHDHALGITRLNVYAGLAGFYLLRDNNENQHIANGVLPGGDYEIEIVIQDRMFTSDGNLYFPSEDPEIEPGFDPLPDVPSIIAEFFGDFILVNSIAWPVLDVEPRKYRFRLLNGSDSRFYILRFDNEMQFYQIGTDVGLLPDPVPLTELLIAPGERADLVVDFTDRYNDDIILQNFGPDDPFKGFNPDGTLSDGEGGVLPSADPNTTGLVMKFSVNLPFDTNIPNATVGVGTHLRPEITPLVQTGASRQLVLFEGLDNFGRLQPLLGTLAEGSLAWFETITENPMLDDVEVWEVYNSTEDAHPIHLHLVAFQIINRESFEGWVEEKDQPQHDGSTGVGGILHITSLGGDSRDPEPNEDGWKDTAIMLPGEVTRVIAKFDLPGRYVWHCHILSHEDHEMMRPYFVGTMPLANEIIDDNENQMLAEMVQGSPVLEQNYPNPFYPETEIRFSLPEDIHIKLRIFNSLGQEVSTLINADVPAGVHTVKLEATNLPSGTYFYQLEAGVFSQKKKMTLIR